MTAEQWLGVVVLVVLVVGTLMVVKRFQPPKEDETVWVNDSTKSQFADYQEKQDSIRKAQWRRQRDTIAVRMQVFDPNTADSSTLVHLGFKPWQAKNMVKYRAAGGKYRKPEDLKKLYGMTDSMYQALTPYIYIAREEVDSVAVDSLRKDSLPRWEEENKDTILNLRTADTVELKMIHGIGSYRARQIVRYREQLGGFASVEQLREIKALQPLLTDSLSADSLLRHFILDSVKVEPLRVNSAHVEHLQRHPYLSFEQAKAIYELRRRKVRLYSLEQLRALDCLSEHDLNRLSPYLNFEPKQK
jgi:competence ComEA-like helix-hairpin-helix protein